MLVKKSLFIFLIIFISLIPLGDLLNFGLPITHDGQDHVARISNFYQSLTEGNIVPRWAENLNWGYGHPILMFLYPLPSYLVSLFHFLGLTFVDSLKFLFGLTYIVSGIAMYLWTREFLNEKAAFFSAILYTFAPYRFIDLYVRGAIGEHVAFVFPPLIFYFLLKLSKKNSYWFILGSAFSLSGLVLSHNAITLMFLPLIFLYIFYLAWQIKFGKYFIFNSFILILLGVGLSSFFAIPAFFEGKYTLRDIVTKGTYALHFIDFKNFIYSEWNYAGSGKFSVQVGILQWILIFLTLPMMLFRFNKKNKLWILNLALLVIFMFTIFIMLPYSQFIWEKFTILQKFQFPWRFLSVIVFTTSILGGLFLFTLSKKIQTFILFFLVAIILFLTQNYWKAQGYIYRPEIFYKGIYDGTTDTGESAPIWSVRFMEKRPRSHLEVIDGDAKIIELKRISILHSYQVITAEVLRFRENTLYFPGWKVYVDGKATNIEFQDPANRGLITFFIPEGEHLLEIKFQETKLRTVANVISTLSLVFIIIYGILYKRLWKRFQ